MRSSMSAEAAGRVYRLNETTKCIILKSEENVSCVKASASVCREVRAHSGQFQGVMSTPPPPNFACIQLNFQTISWSLYFNQHK
jgi:hypothetical protein